MMSYHIEYIPEVHDRTKRLKGNGGKIGRTSEFVIKDLKQETSILNHDGCHLCPQCEQCPLPECTWDYETERKTKKEKGK